MDDRFLDEQRRDPRPEFARQLHARLRAADDAAAPRGAFRFRPAFAGALALAAFAASFTFPAVRATAQQVLDLFRVREFAIVHVDESRLDKLKAANVDGQNLFGPVEKLQDPGPQRVFADVAAAERALGRPLAKAAYAPPGMHADTVFVSGEARGRLTLHTRPLRALMDLMEVNDLDLPADLDGKTAELHMPEMVVQTWRSERRRLAFIQAASPEVALPAGADLERLGEIGLRCMGVGRDEAHRLAKTIDWRSTLVVPVIASATNFRQVSVNGARGVLLETREMNSPDGRMKGGGSVLTWTRDGRLYALLGRAGDIDLVQMAESVR